ncbi:EpsG family protein [Chitinophaga varians]|uniref:EpsG family protein n=1 Tax=Chitinophaga varians TaxID=2202339 RepID=UPI00165F4322|nr:EpsG family protein [Chitinophaga varians]MBC9910590.1 EpsG family protein [Chitinophaga varians]
MIFFVISSLILVFLAGLRFETGGDWPGYTIFFNEVEPLPQVLFGNAPVFQESYMEWGYKIINAVVKSMGGNAQAMFFIIASLSGILLFVYLKRYLKNPIVGVMIYYTTMFLSLDMIAIRQGIAVVLFFGSVRYIYERRFLPFLLIVVIAFLFHRSVVLVLPLYFFLHRKMSTKGYIVCFILSLAVFVLHISWMAPLLKLLAAAIGGVNGLILEAYITNSVYGVARNLSVGTWINILLFILYINNKSKLEEKKYFYCFFNLFMLNIFIYFVCYELIELSNRYRFYFTVCNLVLLPYIIEVYREPLQKLVAYAGIVVFSFLYGRMVFLEMPGAAAYNPYQNYIIYSVFEKRSTGQERLDKSDEAYINDRQSE